MNEHVAYPIAQSLVEEHLSALRNYRVDAVPGLARTVQECVLSVQHAVATLREFDDECPTPREIKNSAWNLRERYLPPQSPVEKWKAEGYTHDPGFRDALLGSIPATSVLKAVPIVGIPADYQDAQEMLKRRPLGQLSPTLDELMWRAIKNRLRVNNFAQVPMGQCWHAAHQMGFPLNDAQETAMLRWVATQPDTIVPAPYSPAPSPTIPAQAEEKRCPRCAGTGRTEDGYCNCSTGRDLALAESPYQYGDEGEIQEEEPSA